MSHKDLRAEIIKHGIVEGYNLSDLFLWDVIAVQPSQENDFFVKDCVVVDGLSQKDKIIIRRKNSNNLLFTVLWYMYVYIVSVVIKDINIVRVFIYFFFATSNLSLTLA